MRITKNIKYEYASKLGAFSKIQERLNKLKENDSDNSISKKELKELNYFLVIECKDVSDELGFGKKTNGVSFAFFGEKERHNKFLTHIRKKNSQPPFFKKIGLLYDVTGCYLVATTKSNKKKITINKSSNTIPSKINMNKLPEDIEDMCVEFEEYQFEVQRNTFPEMEDIFGLSVDDKEKIIESIVSGMMFTEKPVEKEYHNYDFVDLHNSKNQIKLNIEQVIESKIDEIYDIPFLEQVMENAIENENFELCSKIRDRINYLKK